MGGTLPGTCGLRRRLAGTEHWKTLPCPAQLCEKSRFDNLAPAAISVSIGASEELQVWIRNRMFLVNMPQSRTMRVFASQMQRTVWGRQGAPVFFRSLMHPSLILRLSISAQGSGWLCEQDTLAVSAAPRRWSQVQLEGGHPVPPKGGRQTQASRLHHDLQRLQRLLVECWMPTDT